jgi:hypothetical protein
MAEVYLICTRITVRLVRWKLLSEFNDNLGDWVTQNQ